MKSVFVNQMITVLMVIRSTVINISTAHIMNQRDVTEIGANVTAIWTRTVRTVQRKASVWMEIAFVNPMTIVQKEITCTARTCIQFVETDLLLNAILQTTVTAHMFQTHAAGMTSANVSI